MPETFKTNLTISSLDEKFIKLYFAWVSLAPFCTIVTQNIKWHKNFPILLNLKKNEKSIKIDKVITGYMG